MKGRSETDMEERIPWMVYQSLLGQLIPEYSLPGVKEIFVPGHPCYQEYERMHRAYTRLRARLGDVEEDPDGEEMIDALLQYSRILALEMFSYGQAYQRKNEGK